MSGRLLGAFCRNRGCTGYNYARRNLWVQMWFHRAIAGVQGCSGDSDCDPFNIGNSWDWGVPSMSFLVGTLFPDQSWKMHSFCSLARPAFEPRRRAQRLGYWALQEIKELQEPNDAVAMAPWW